VTKIIAFFPPIRHIACAFAETASVMTRALFSSGDLIADRRAQYAEMLAESGDWAGAADLMSQAMERVPDWAPGWDLLGHYHEEAGQLDAAKTAWRRLLLLDPAGLFGASLKLAAHGEGPASASVGYVRALFDDYAHEFEAALVGRLAYRVPELIEARLAATGPAFYERALDLGCGTGLMGALLRKRAGFLQGVDLSAEMIAACRRKGIYDRLCVGELLAYLEASGERFDLVTAADVFVYCGDLPPIFAAVARALPPGGRFAFSVELNEGPEDVVLRQSLRFAHGQEAVLLALAEAGFSTVSASREVLRQDRGAPVAGLVVVASAVAGTLAAGGSAAA
jgi:predicted TPR repeat methyltransferase